MSQSAPAQACTGISGRQAARIIGCTYHTLLRLVAEGRVRSFARLGRLKFDRDDAERVAREANREGIA